MADPSALLGPTKSAFLGLCSQLIDGAGVDGGVEVHGALYDEDDGEDSPFLEPGEAEAELFVGVLLLKLDATVVFLLVDI